MITWLKFYSSLSRLRLQIEGDVFNFRVGWVQFPSPEKKREKKFPNLN